MTKFFRDFVRDDSGAAAAEYVILLAIAGGAVAAGALYFGSSIQSALETKGDNLVACASGTTASCK